MKVTVVGTGYLKWVCGADMAEVRNDLLRCPDKEMDALDDADALQIETEWMELRRADQAVSKDRLKTSEVIDGRKTIWPSVNTHTRHNQPGRRPLIVS